MNNIQTSKLKEQVNQINEGENIENEISIIFYIRFLQLKSTLNLDKAVEYVQKLNNSSETDINGTKWEELIYKGDQSALLTH